MYVKNFRSLGYFALDFLKGSKIRKNLVDIEKNIGNNNSNSKLHDILKYAKSNVPYYKNISNASLCNFPVVSKKTIVNKFDDFQSKEYKNADLHWVSTSGSTGEPFKANQNSEKRNRTIADLIYIHSKNGWMIGEKYIYLRAWMDKYSASKFKVFLQNYIAVDIVNFDDEKKKSLRKQLQQDKNIKVILGYASAMEDFVNYLERMGDNKSMFHVKVIFTVSDNLTLTTKHKLEEMFDCPVINRYSNEEQGVLAFTPANNDEFLLNTASYYFELLKIESDEPADCGEVGRLVVTDLYNQSMPFIRYETGDLAITNDDSGQQITSLTSLQGRVTDIIHDTSGNIITAVIVNNYFAEFYEMKKYQLIQLDTKEYCLKVVEDNDKSQVNAYKNTCIRLLGKDAIVDVKIVENIPSEQNGKYKTIINKVSLD